MSKKKNKWEVPEAPPPLFAGQKERNFAKQVSDELIEKVIGQPVLYYPIDLENTDYHFLYGESIKKSFFNPVRVYVLVEFEDEGYVAEDSFGVERRTRLNLFFHKRRLVEDQNLFVRVGDFVEYNQIYYEIVKLAEPRQLFGQAQYKIEIQALCIRSRYNVFNTL